MMTLMNLGKLELSGDIETMIGKLYKNGFEILPIIPQHLITLSSLDYYHRDPFDRLIISQGISEKIKIVSSDSMFDNYNIVRIWN